MDLSGDALVWAVLFEVLSWTLGFVVAAHAVLHKRDTRAAIGWASIILFRPLIGSFFYATLGINRIRRRARGMRTLPPAREDRPQNPADVPEPLQALAVLAGRATGLPLEPGNRVQLLDGEEAFEVMLDAIGRAKKTIVLTTYIFDVDGIGSQFVDALADANDRGVEVRVLIDAVGTRYSHPRPQSALQKRGVPVALFMPTRVPWRLVYANLRSHRKLMVIDGVEAYTGGMNIREGPATSLAPLHPFRDLHCRIDGPAVAQLMRVFLDDWAFATRERLPEWFVPAVDLPRVGPTCARVVPDGPDEDFEKLRLVLLGAIGAARRRLRIVTPYFLPDAGIVTALNVAAMRGVTVDIIVPGVNNLKLVQWASWPVLDQLTHRGCRIWATRAPFDHTKLVVVDEGWTLLGSGNWDPRSLRLNFELNVECYDPEVARAAIAVVHERLQDATRITHEYLCSLPLHIRLRNGLARLFSPYL